MIKFCPRCHRRIEVPEFLKTAKIKIKGGMNIKCGYCNQGVVTFTKKELK